MMTMQVRSLSYLAILALTVALCLGAVLALNRLVDPLWYFGGNRLGAVNFAFNERVSKVNLFLRNEKGYDCVIFGDSRVTLLPEQAISGYRCFNFAFSAGNVEEFIAYAEYLRKREFSPRLVIVGVSAGDFRKYRFPYNVPSFVTAGEAPASPWIAYLSLDALRMSLRSLAGDTPLDRVYDVDFHCRAADRSAIYDPRIPIRNLRSGPFPETGRVELYRKLGAIFPQAHFIGYAPPLSAWALKEYESIGWLESYVGALHEAADAFERFADYSAPSAMTADAASTYDGTHYAETANAVIAANLPDGLSAEALDLKVLPEAEALAAYRSRLAHYADRLHSAQRRTD
jgi:hypothetical protein